MDVDTLEEGKGEEVIARLLYERLVAEESLSAAERENLACRVAEVMVAAKALYTQALPRLLHPQEGGAPLEEELTGLRMTLLHLRDCVTDFDHAFLEAMFDERQAHPDQVYDQWQDPGDDSEWTPEELGPEDESGLGDL